MKACVFCTIVRGEKSAQIVSSSEHFIAFKDTHPVVPGHTLIIPKKHYVTFLDIPTSLSEEFVAFAKSVASELLESKKGDGFNFVMNNLPAAGQEVPHAHMHVIPRKEGDGIRFLTKESTGSGEN